MIVLCLNYDVIDGNLGAAPDVFYWLSLPRLCCFCVLDFLAISLPRLFCLKYITKDINLSDILFCFYLLAIRDLAWKILKDLEDLHFTWFLFIVCLVCFCDDIADKAYGIQVLLPFFIEEENIHAWEWQRNILQREYQDGPLIRHQAQVILIDNDSVSQANETLSDLLPQGQTRYPRSCPKLSIDECIQGMN